MTPKCVTKHRGRKECASLSRPQPPHTFESRFWICNVFAPRARLPHLAEVVQHPRRLSLAEPGGGKAVVTRAAVQERLQAGRIPILVELKEYRGDLTALLRTVAPEGLLGDDAARRTHLLDGID